MVDEGPLVFRVVDKSVNRASDFFSRPVGIAQIVCHISEQKANYHREIFYQFPWMDFAQL